MTSVRTLTIGIFLFILFSSTAICFGQKRYKCFFYPESIIVDGFEQTLDTTKGYFRPNTTSRVIIWENEFNKVSVLCKVKSNKRRIVTKERTEIFKDGKWKKAKLRIRLIERRFLNISRWTSKGWSTKSSMVTSSKSGINIKETYLGEENQYVELTGYCEIIWK
jgi:hypothetical protein